MFSTVVFRKKWLVRGISAPTRLAALLALTVLAAGCPMEMPDPPVDRNVSFSMDIQPILDRECVSCHSAGGFAVNVGIPMRLEQGMAYDEIVNQPSAQDDNFTLVIPGDAANSLFFLKVSEEMPPVGSTMPLFSAPLTAAEQGLIRDWIDQGALDN